MMTVSRSTAKAFLVRPAEPGSMFHTRARGGDGGAAIIRPPRSRRLPHDRPDGSLARAGGRPIIEQAAVDHLLVQDGRAPRTRADPDGKRAILAGIVGEDRAQKPGHH